MQTNKRNKRSLDPGVIYIPREDVPRDVVEIIEKKGDQTISHGFREVADLIGEHIPPELRIAASFGMIRHYHKSIDMAIEARKYFEWAVANPITKTEAIKGGAMAGNLVQIEVPRPWTLQALLVWMNISTKQWHKYRSDDVYREFHDICDAIENAIRTQKMEHAMVGNYNANVVMRDIGVSENKMIETKSSVEVTHKVVGMRIIDMPEEVDSDDTDEQFL